ncbi:LPXTG cell wall anchor domain-containing protein [Streptomyces sp. GC420]|nr:LPXTG cell wall anchor domain-containing protein [Streptomyces sp. GC420]
MAGTATLGVFAGSAQAHTPRWNVTCSEVTVDLTAYGKNSSNTVTITADGKDLLPTETFGDEFHKTLELPEHSEPVDVRLVLEASDGKQFSVDETKTAPVCEDDDTPKPSETPSESATPTTGAPTPADTPTSEAPAPETSSAAAEPSNEPSADTGGLAETGSSSATPLIAGAAAVVIVAGGGLVWATRKRRGAADN